MKELELAQQQLNDSVEFYKHISSKKHPASFDVGSAWKTFLSQQETKITDFWDSLSKERL